MAGNNYGFRALARLTAIDRASVVRSMVDTLGREAIPNTTQADSFNPARIISDLTGHECVHPSVAWVYLMYELQVFCCL